MRQSSWSLEYVRRQFQQGWPTRREQHASYPSKVIHLNPPLQLLKAKPSSALMDARKMEEQLARLTRSAETAGITTNLRCIVQMFRDHIATLDEAIKSAKLKEC
jgi:hypothetical protein